MKDKFDIMDLGSALLHYILLIVLGATLVLAVFACIFIPFVLSISAVREAATFSILFSTMRVYDYITLVTGCILSIYIYSKLWSLVKILLHAMFVDRSVLDGTFIVRKFSRFKNESVVRE